jgi:carbon-monoxide dehydrogenase large subunit
MTVTGIGASVKRVEDFRFLTGQGNYTDDINRPNQTYVWILRSPHAHAKITSLDVSAAESAPGVVAIFTGKDMEADGVGSLPCGWQVNNKDDSPMAEPAHPPLAVDRVRHVGDQVAAVIAETKDQARQAAEMIAVEYEPLPVVTDMSAAIQGGPQVHDDVPNNLCYDWHIGDKDATAAAFANAAHVASIDIVNNRLIPNAMEPRAAIGDYDTATGDHTLFTTSQNPHVIRLLMGAFVLNIPEHKLRVVAPDVGGGFGPRPRSRHQGRAGSGQRRQIPRPPGRHAGQYGRLSVHLRALRPDLSVRHAAGGRLHDATGLLRGEGGLHQHRAGRRLPRRGPPGSVFPD